jgi:hypothetical protein
VDCHFQRRRTRAIHGTRGVDGLCRRHECSRYFVTAAPQRPGAWPARAPASVTTSVIVIATGSGTSRAATAAVAR